MATHRETPNGATLMLHLLGQCNLECRHCYMGGSPTRREELPLEWVLQAIADADALGIGTLYLTGGEPLLYRGFAEALAAASATAGLRTTVCTNGTMVSERIVTTLTGAGAEVNVSVDGSPAFHDAFRARRGAFAKTDRGVRMMSQAGIPITIVHTVLRDNLGMIADVAAWATEVGARRLLVQPLLRLGRGDAIADRRLTVDQANELVLSVSDVANRYVGRLRCTMISPTLDHLRAHPCAAYVCNGAGCHRRVAQEIKKIVVREDGAILPEVTNLDPRYAIGRVGDGPLSELCEAFFARGYAEFDALCRTTYEELIPSWPSTLVPWDQLVADRSVRPLSEASSVTAEGCSTCGADSRCRTAAPG